MAKNKRPCPALRELISSARCGEERGVTISCPAECEFNPFGPQNADQFLDIEQRTMTKAIDRYRVVRAGARTDQVMHEVSTVHAAVGYAQLLELLREDRGTSGLTFAEDWEAEGFKGLSNDERHLFRAALTARMAVLEVHRQLDDTRLEVVDLLDETPTPFVIFDPALAKVWGRFSTWLSWVYEAPHFVRPTSSAIQVCEIGASGLTETLSAIIAHLGGPPRLSEAREWLGGNLKRFLESALASMKAVQEATLKAMEMQVGKTRYQWTNEAASDRLRTRLSEAPEFRRYEPAWHEEQEGWVECWHFEEEAVKAGGVLLGRILLGPAGVLLCGSAGAPPGAVRERFDTLAEGLVAFQAERIDDLASQIRQRHPVDFDASLVPPVFLEQASKMTMSVGAVDGEDGPTAGRVSGHMKSYLRKWLDKPEPALSDLSPREAVGDPALRPKVAEMMKRQVRSFDSQARETGLLIDISDILQELGLVELVFPAPEMAAPSGRPEIADEVDDEVIQALFEAQSAAQFEPEDWEYDPSVIEVPAASRELSMEEVMRRFSHTPPPSHARHNASAYRMIQWPEVPHLIEDMGVTLNSEELSFLNTQLLISASVLFPVRPAELKLYPGRVWYYYAEERNRIEEALRRRAVDDAGGLFIDDCPQTALLTLVAATVFASSESKPAARQKGGLALDKMTVVEIVCFVRAFIRELSHWPVD